MNRIERRFHELADKGEKAFIPFITAGDPTMECTERLVLALEAAGADIVELGVPFSDPLADGPVNQEAAQRALKHHVTLQDILEAVRHIRRQSEIPIVLFTYYNPVLAYGVQRLAEEGAEVGVDGVLCVDLPPEEAESYEQALRGKGLSTVYLLAPTSTDERIRLVAERSSGFVYYVSRTGTTGERDQVEATVKSKVATIKKATQLPVAVGFGISNPQQAAEVAGYGDGVVVGSAIVRKIGELGDSPDMPERVGAFVRELVAATKGH